MVIDIGRGGKGEKRMPGAGVYANSSNKTRLKTPGKGIVFEN